MPHLHSLCIASGYGFSEWRRYRWWRPRKSIRKAPQSGHGSPFYALQHPENMFLSLAAAEKASDDAGRPHPIAPFFASLLFRPVIWKPP
jgi:hypothetical protein